MLYFAYGSNLSTIRLARRVPSAEFASTGVLRKHRLAFHKVGRDGTAKCDACFTGHESDFLYGALYRINPSEKTNLDHAEGLGNGYEIKQVNIVTGTGSSISAFTYCATKTADNIKPFDWYKNHVLSGAREHCFPEHYIEQITVVVSLPDHDRQRAATELEMYTSPVIQENG